MYQILLESMVVVILSAGGAFLGYSSSKLRKPYWLLGYIAPLILLGLITSARVFPRLSFIAPFSWLVYGLVEFALLGPIVVCLLTCLICKLPRRRLKWLLGILLVLAYWQVCLGTFLGPLFVRGDLLSRAGRRVGGGRCLQSTSYTCGPAAAVTALGHFGIEAREGEIAIWARTNYNSGTAQDLLCQSLNEHFNSKGIVAKNRYFHSLEELRGCGVTIAVIKYSFLVDHYVTVFEVTDEEVIYFDPMNGDENVPRDTFKKIWRSTGIVVEKQKTF